MRQKIHFRILLGIGLLTAILFMTGCQKDTRIKSIKLAHALDSSHPVHKALVFMSERFEEKSDGKYRIEIYHGGQLGSEREYVELLQIGSLGMTKVSCSVVEGFVKKFNVFSLPYIFRDDEHRFKVLEGEIGTQLLLEGEKYWVRGLCYLDAGSRSFYSTKKPINSPTDLQGLKVRTQ
ncbi:MAG: TRAP transporter substrate-binding protein DctP, partial [Candidatus Marinimicrobia bacterium]|nr:TRAP transporter substrate-binding protein DctP [Candidatus Neomarinimicrobiota bacterium]